MNSIFEMRGKLNFRGSEYVIRSRRCVTVLSGTKFRESLHVVGLARENPEDTLRLIVSARHAPV